MRIRPLVVAERRLPPVLWRLAALAHGGDEEHDADEEDERDELEGEATLIIAKQRNGPTGVVKLAFLRQITKFESLASGSSGDF